MHSSSLTNPLSTVSCSYLVVDGEISISCLSGGSEVEAMYEVIINGEVATALTGELLPSQMKDLYLIFSSHRLNRNGNTNHHRHSQPRSVVDWCE